MSSAAVLADDKRDCLEGINHDLRIKGCSAVIGSNPNDAIAYFTRGLAYQFKGESIEPSQTTTGPSSSIPTTPQLTMAEDALMLAKATTPTLLPT